MNFSVSLRYFYRSISRRQKPVFTKYSFHWRTVPRPQAGFLCITRGSAATSGVSKTDFLRNIWMKLISISNAGMYPGQHRIASASSVSRSSIKSLPMPYPLCDQCKFFNRVTSKRVKLGASVLLYATRVPPCRSTISFASASPIPIPSGLPS